MAIRKSLLTTVNDEQNPQPNILFMNGGGGGAEYTGIDPIVVENDTISIKDNWSAITSINNRIDTVNSNLIETTNDLTALQSNYDTFVESVPETYVNKETYAEDIDTITQKLDTLSETVDTKASQSELDSLSDTVDSKASQSDLEALENRVETNENNIDSLSATATSLIDTTTQLRSDLNNVDDTIQDIITNVEELTEELDDKISYSAIGYNSDFTSVTALNGCLIDDPDSIKHIYLYDGVIYTELQPGGEYYPNSLLIPFASAADPIQGTTGTPGVISVDDKSKLDNITMFSSDSAEMQVTYVGENKSSGYSTFIGYSGDNLGFYDLNVPIVSAIEDPSVMEDSNNWSKHPFGLTPELSEMLSAISSVWETRSAHPNAMMGMTGGQFGWIDLA